MKHTQIETLLSAFKSGERLTANNCYGIAPFSQRIKDIEDKGYRVERCWIAPPSGNKYMEYWISADQFKVAA